MTSKVYRRSFTIQARQAIRELHPLAKNRIRCLTDKLLESPYMGKPLQRELEGFYSVKHQKYRVIYQIDAVYRKVIICYVGLRKDVYEIFSTLVGELKKKRRQ